MAKVEKNGVAEQNRIADIPEMSKEVKQLSKLKIQPLRQARAVVPIIGVTPLKILRFSQKQKNIIQETQEAGSQAKSKKKRDPKDFEENYKQALYSCTQVIDEEEVTWYGLNATGVRNGCIATCRVADMVMTRAKMSIFCEQDGFDDLDQTPLVRIYGEPQMSIDPVRNASGVIDLRSRGMFREWRMILKIRFDLTQFSGSDVVNLLARVGQQNGLGEGRPNGSKGNGTDNGIFRVDYEQIQMVDITEPPFIFEEDK